MRAPTIWSAPPAVPARVLILSWEYPPIVEGGLARHVRKLSEQLVAQGTEVHVLTRGGGRLAGAEDRHGVTVHRVREPDFPKHDLDAFISWVDHMNEDMRAAGAELLDEIAPDLVHSHDWLVAGAARRLARTAEVPWLVTVHATEYGRHQGWVDKHPQSHIHLALDALPGMIERLGDVRFLVAGSGTAEAELKEQAERLGLMEHGSFVGWTGDDELHSLYRIADLCLVPSIYEPFGLVALEAMASGCPCIVADTGGLREVVPGGRRVGLRFRAKDSKALGRMAEQLLSDDALRDRLVAEAREHVLRFDWADVARQTAAVYGEVGGAAGVGTTA